MHRRVCIGGAAAVVAALPPAIAQQPVKVRRLAIVSPFEPAAVLRGDSENRYYGVLFAELQRLGHVEGKTLTIERYGREQAIDGLDALATEVVRSGPDLVFFSGPGVASFKGATVPVVALTGNPLGQGVAQSLAHPGGNITGVSVDAGPMYAKRIELLRELAPGITKLGVLVQRIQWEVGASRLVPAACEANRLACAPRLLEEPTSAGAYREAITAVKQQGADALIVADNPDAVVHRTAVIETAAAARLPAMYFLRDFVDAGGLAAYTFDLVELNRQAARDIDAILRGAKAGDIPFFQNTKFNLYLNLKTAKALGLAVPQPLLALADEVIE